MGSSFVSIDGEHGFWIRDALLEAWLRLLALHIPEPNGGDSPAVHAASKEIRDRWLLASKGFFTGCVPDALSEGFATEQGRAVVIAATDSLISALQKAPGALHKETLDLLGLEGGVYAQDIPVACLMEVGNAFRELYAGRITSTAGDSSPMLGWQYHINKRCDSRSSRRGVEQPELPTLIVVTGRPGAGKSTLAHALARAIRCPAICRDEIKEGLINTLGDSSDLADQIRRRAYETFFETVTLLLGRGVTLVAEAAFQHKVWEPKLQPLRNLAQIRIIICDLDAQLARSRWTQRHAADPLRRRFHPDDPGDSYEAPHLDVPTLAVDTSGEYRPTLAAIVAFARGGVHDARHP